MNQTIPVEFPTDWTDYELIDSGNGAKLERFGPPAGGYVISRPDPRILWEPTNPSGWSDADAIFLRTGSESGSWQIKKNPPEPWLVSYQKLTFVLKPTEFKHTGVFPEQAVNWKWLTEQIAGRPLKVLNLFAYTGGASLASTLAGAQVTHVDSVKSSISWANENAERSHTDPKKIRWIEDDAYKFVLREARRGNTYDGIIMDPPRFGRGPKGEVWKVASDLPKLLDSAASILSSHAHFLLVNAYTADFSAIALFNLVSGALKSGNGIVSFGELALQESIGKRLLPQGLFVRWQRNNGN